MKTLEVISTKFACAAKRQTESALGETKAL
jgi:hypothetical protein